MPQESHHYVWPLIVSIAFLIHYVSSSVNVFKEVQDSALEAYASKRGTTFLDHEELEQHIRDDETIKDNKIKVPDKALNQYVWKNLVFLASCFVITAAALIFEMNKIREHSKHANDIAVQHAANHAIIGYMCFIGLLVVALGIGFASFKYFTRDEKVTAVNNAFVKWLYRWMPYLDEFAFAVVIGEFALFWFE